MWKKYRIYCLKEKYNTVLHSYTIDSRQDITMIICKFVNIMQLIRKYDNDGESEGS